MRLKISGGGTVEAAFSYLIVGREGASHANFVQGYSNCKPDWQRRRPVGLVARYHAVHLAGASAGSGVVSDDRCDNRGADVLACGEVEGLGSVWSAGKILDRKGRKDFAKTAKKITGKNSHQDRLISVYRVLRRYNRAINELLSRW